MVQQVVNQANQVQPQVTQQDQPQVNQANQVQPQVTQQDQPQVQPQVQEEVRQPDHEEVKQPDHEEVKQQAPEVNQPAQDQLQLQQQLNAKSEALQALMQDPVNNIVQITEISMEISVLLS